MIVGLTGGIFGLFMLAGVLLDATTAILIRGTLSTSNAGQLLKPFLRMVLPLFRATASRRTVFRLKLTLFLTRVWTTPGPMGML